MERGWWRQSGVIGARKKVCAVAVKDEEEIGAREKGGTEVR